MLRTLAQLASPPLGGRCASMIATRQRPFDHAGAHRLLAIGPRTVVSAGKMRKLVEIFILLAAKIRIGLGLYSGK